MIIKKIELINFRNYICQSAEFSEGTNIIYGDNAQGKTNLLEAMYIFSTAHSHRSQIDKEMISFDSDYAKVKISFISNERDFDGEITLYRNKAKTISLNGVSIKKISLLPEYFRAVLFSPEDMNLVKEGPELRRKFLDQAISSLKPNYFTILQNYNLALKQKNMLLKSIKQKPNLISTLPVWNHHLADYGARMTLYRKSFIDTFKDYVNKNQTEITKGEENLEMTYRPSLKTDDYYNNKALYNSFMDRQQALEKAEIEKGTALCGPHRDDIDFNINSYDARHFGSQGQQRTIVLCLKLALMEIINDKTGEYPILLLDDVMSELDQSRRDYISSKIENKQVMITSNDKIANGKKYFKIEKGNIEVV